MRSRCIYLGASPLRPDGTTHPDGSGGPRCCHGIRGAWFAATSTQPILHQVDGCNPEAPPAAAPRPVAFGRRRYPDSRHAPLSLASRRSARERARRLVQSRRNAKAARRFFRKLLKGLRSAPRVLVTDGPRSCGAAKRETMPGVQRRRSRYLNNRAKVSHQSTRRRERQMQRFGSACHTQRVRSTQRRIHNLFQLRRHRRSASDYRAARSRAFAIREIAAPSPRLPMPPASATRRSSRGYFVASSMPPRARLAPPPRRAVTGSVFSEQVLRQPERVVAGGLDIAAGYRVADAGGRGGCRPGSAASPRGARTSISPPFPSAHPRRRPRADYSSSLARPGLTSGPSDRR